MGRYCLVRNSDRTWLCVQHPEWNGGWKCELKEGGIDHRLMVIESMDWDTEDRRLSPIAVIIDNHVDLINGPQVGSLSSYCNHTMQGDSFTSQPTCV